MKTKLSIVLLLLIIALSGCSEANKEYIQLRAEKRWEEVGFRVVGYEGHQWGMGIGKYGGACVWYQLETMKPNGVRYTGYLQRWGDEPLQVYGPKAIDAIKPN
jgi:hypothetical protein